MKGPPEATSLLVADVAAPAGSLATPLDLEGTFAEAYARLHGRLVKHAERYVSEEEARDAVGDAMASMWRRWPALVREQRSDKYFFGAVHYCALARMEANDRLVSMDHAKKELERQAVGAVGAVGAAGASGGERGADRRAEVLDAALLAMPRRRREVFLLVREEGFTYQEAAEVLGLKYETVHSHMRQASEDLRAAFTRAGYQIAASQPARLPAPEGGATND